MRDKYKNLSEEEEENIKIYQKNYRKKLYEKQYFRRKKGKNERISIKLQGKKKTRNLQLLESILV